MIRPSSAVVTFLACCTTRSTPAVEQSPQPGEQSTIRGLQSRPDDLKAEHGDLVAEHGDLDRQFVVVPPAQAYQLEDSGEGEMEN